MTMTTAELLLEWDRRRPRSRQTDLGMSELGGCPRRAKFRLLGTEPTDEAGSVQAVLGTLIHEAIQSVLTELQKEGVIPPEDLIESELQFAGLIGHNDRYDSAAETLVDTKTTSQRNLDYYLEHGISKSWEYQTANYAAALIKRGLPVKRIRIDVIARDTGNEATFERPFNPAEVQAAMEWLAEVKHTPLEELPRAYAPESVMCARCPFRTPCWGEPEPGRDPRSVIFAELPNAEVWAAQLSEGRAMAKRGKELADEAKGVLDALRPNDRGKELVDVGLPDDKVLSFSVSPKRYPDMDQIEADYAERGLPVPKKSTPSVTLLIVNKPKPKKTKANKEGQA